MEGVQHRWDCPTLGKPDVVDYVFTRDDGSRTWRTHCEGCGRAAIIHKPKETTDDKR